MGPSRLTVLLLVTACSFNRAGSPGAGGGGGDGGGDPAGDAGPCPEAIRTAFTVDGVSSGAATEGEPLVTVLLGDTIQLDAAPSCTLSGAVGVAWSFAPDVSATALPAALDAPALSIYASAPGDLTVTLAVSDGASAGEPVSATIEVVGWAQPLGSLDIRDLAVAGGVVWIAATGDAYLQALDLLDAPVARVNDLDGGDDDIPNDLSAVHADGQGHVWFAHKPADNQVWRVDAEPLLLAQVTAIDFRDDAGLEDDTEVRAIAGAAGGVALATKDGVTVTENGQSFLTRLTTDDTFAVSGAWAGGQSLYSLTGGADATPFGDGDNKIRALADEGALVWAGSDDGGVARFVPAGASSDVFTTADGLTSNKVRDLVVDTGGDVWAATDAGIARFKQDRRVWVPMRGPAGLAGALDVRALAVSAAGESRFVLAGTQSGLAILRAPP